MEVLKFVGVLLLVILLAYIVVRVGSSAYFQSRLDFEKLKSKGGEDGKRKIS